MGTKYISTVKMKKPFSSEWAFEPDINVILEDLADAIMACLIDEFFEIKVKQVEG